MPPSAPHREGIQQALDRFMAAPPSLRPPHPAVQETPPAYAVNRPDDPTGYFSSLQVIGQFQAAYILCQGSQELVIIDQHAAYERVRFEQLKAAFLAGTIESQRLLLPETLELSFVEADAARRHQHRLLELGFELEAFGGQTFRLNAVPRMIADGEQLRLLRDLLADLASIGASGSFDQLRDDLLSRVACHSVVRGAHPLDRRQMDQLLKDMDRTDFSAHCPHGRPVSHSIGLGELEKLFKRT
jgi:DNA mismatch repair protein MutL